MKQIMSTEKEWLEIRSKYITASEAAVLVGMNPYSSPGQIKGNNTFTGNAYTKLGHILEPTVVVATNLVLNETFKLYETIEGKPFYTRGHLGATPDARNRTELLECKSTKPDSFERYRENPPTNYLVQVQVQLWCTNKKVGYLAILSTDLTQSSQELNLPIVIYKVLRNEEFCNIMEQESTRYFEDDKKFRVNSAVKKRVAQLLQESTTKIYEPVKVQKMSLKEYLKEKGVT